MTIVKRIFFGGFIDDIPAKGMPFEFKQSNLTSIEPLVIGNNIYWVVTITYHNDERN